MEKEGLSTALHEVPEDRSQTPQHIGRNPIPDAALVLHCLLRGV